MSKIDLNQADVEALAQLNGIGDQLAARIITYRETVHPFEETIELAAVPGISERMVRALADEITVGRVPAEEESAGPELAVTGLSPETPGTRIAAPMQSPAVAGPLPAEQPEETNLPEEVPAPRAGGASVFGYLLTAFFGALLGAGLTLFLLYALNGTLDFASPGQVARVQNQVLTQGEEQRGLSEEIRALSTRQSRAVAAGTTTTARLEETAGELATLEQGLAGLEQEVGDDVEALEADTAVLATRVSGLSDAAENFDLFLDGMRNLLIELRGLPPMPTPTPTITTTATITATAAAGENTPAPAATATPTPVVTRTPRPTATPFVNPAATAVNLP